MAVLPLCTSKDPSSMKALRRAERHVRRFAQHVGTAPFSSFFFSLLKHFHSKIHYEHVLGTADAGFCAPLFDAERTRNVLTFTHFRSRFHGSLLRR